MFLTRTMQFEVYYESISAVYLPDKVPNKKPMRVTVVFFFSSLPHLFERRGRWQCDEGEVVQFGVLIFSGSTFLLRRGLFTRPLVA